MTETPVPAALVAFAIRLAEAARLETLPRFRNSAGYENKSADGVDPVTDADRAAERAQRALIAETYPDHGILGEEYGEQLSSGSDYRWVLDPIDGTRAFVCGATSWATLIALERGGRPAIGVIDQPYTNERWVGQSGGTRFFSAGSAPIDCTVSACTLLQKARVSTTDPRPGRYFGIDAARRFAAIADRAAIARFSLDAYAYGLLALGELDLVIETGLKRHDFAALLPIIAGAGGVVSAWNGDRVESDPNGSIVAAATPALHRAALEALNS